YAALKVASDDRVVPLIDQLRDGDDEAEIEEQFERSRGPMRFIDPARQHRPDEWQRRHGERAFPMRKRCCVARSRYPDRSHPRKQGIDRFPSLNGFVAAASG